MEASVGSFTFEGNLEAYSSGCESAMGFCGQRALVLRLPAERELAHYLIQYRKILNQTATGKPKRGKRKATRGLTFFHNLQYDLLIHDKLHNALPSLGLDLA